jgi:hypothetical protein
LSAAAAMVAAFMLAAGSAAAQDQPPGDIENVRLVGNIPTDTQSTAINFLQYGKGRNAQDVMFTTGRVGQIAYYRPDETNMWAPYFHGDFIYTADHGRGIDILQLTAGAERARGAVLYTGTASRQGVMTRSALRIARVAVERLSV